MREGLRGLSRGGLGLVIPASFSQLDEKGRRKKVKMKQERNYLYFFPPFLCPLFTSSSFPSSSSSSFYTSPLASGNLFLLLVQP